MSPSKSKNILLGITGSIAAYKTAFLISRLVQDGHQVQTVATENALKFIGTATLQGFTGREVLVDTFATGKMMSHIDAARWADLFIIAPLTAAHLNKIAYGIGDDLLSTLALAFERSKPFYVAPAMNSEMWNHPAVQEGLSRILSHGVRVLSPNSGTLACGEVGVGKMMEPDEIFSSILDDSQTSNAPATKSHRILVTYGGTREPIDGVRAITNISTGETGARLIDDLVKMGHSVTVIAAKTAIKPKNVSPNAEFDSTDDLREILTKELAACSYDAIFHLAAISDYTVDTVNVDGERVSPTKSIKLGSEKSITIELKKNPKIIDSIKRISKDPHPQIVAFKLTNTKDRVARNTAIEKLLKVPGVSLVVHNDVTEIDKARGVHPFTIYGQAGLEKPCADVHALAKTLIEFIKPKTSKPVSSSRFEVNHDLMS